MGRDIRSYNVFKASHALTLEVYKITGSFPAQEKFALSNQMRRSASSVPMNLVEGSARGHESEFRQFVNIARGSCAELSYQLELSRDLSYIDSLLFDRLFAQCGEIGKMLNVLHQRLMAKS